MTDPRFAAVLRLLRVNAMIETRFTAALSAHGLALREMLLLMNLAASPAGRMRRVDLAAALSISQSSVTRMVLPLEKTGLVTRQSDPRDARVGYVALTAAGDERVADAAVTLERMTELVFADRWPNEEVAALSALLGRLSAPLPGALA